MSPTFRTWWLRPLIAAAQTAVAELGNILGAYFQKQQKREACGCHLVVDRLT